MTIPTTAKIILVNPFFIKVLTDRPRWWWWWWYQQYIKLHDRVCNYTLTYAKKMGYN